METNVKNTVNVNGHSVNVTVDNYDEMGVIAGGMTVPAHGLSLAFYWERRRYSRPYVRNVREHGAPVRDHARLQRAADFAAQVLRAYTTENVLSNDGSGHADHDGGGADYESLLLVDGHVRRPCIVRHACGREVIRRATIVNRANLTDEEAAQAAKVVNAWNALVEEFTGQSVLSFGEWLEQRGIQ